MPDQTNHPLSFNNANEITDKRAKKEWATPDILIMENKIESGSIPWSFEDVPPFNTFQHS
ncbi:MAG TPA: hypothetical protein VIM89_19750 [Mucilaginibacter sp.]